MNSLASFEAFKLNKVQMNMISGGAKGIYCSGKNGETAHFEKHSSSALSLFATFHIIN